MPTIDILTPGIRPEVLAIVGVMWILREVFGFLRKTKSLDRHEKIVKIVRVEDADFRALGETLQKVGENFEAQTKLLTELTYEMRSVREQMHRFETDLNGLKNDMHRRSH